MKLSRLFEVTLLGINRDRKGFLLSALGVAVGVAAFVFFVGLGEGVSSLIRERIFPVETSHIKVIPPRVSLGAFFGGGVLDDDALERLRNLDGVTNLYKEIELKVPAVSRYDGDFFGRRVRMGVDILAVGVESKYLEKDLPSPSFFTDPGDSSLVLDGDEENAVTIPAVVSRRLIELYNTTFAPARGLPRLTERQIIGFRFPVTLGASFVSRTRAGTRRSVVVEVVGVSDRALLIGLTLPLETVKRWNAIVETGEDVGETVYSSVVLETEGPDRVREVIAAIRSSGFDVDQTEQKLAEEIGAAISLTTLVLSFLSFLILGLAAISISRAAHAGVIARMREIGVMRAVGATRLDVARVVLSESLAAGFVGGIAGVCMAWVAAISTDLVVDAWASDFPFKPETFFMFPLWLPVAAMSAALFSAFIGALLPSVKAAFLDPVRAISGSS